MKKYLVTPPCFTHERMAKVANGCGPKGWKEKLVPDSILWIPITDACNLHDYEYHYGLDWEDKERADLTFHHNIKLIIKHETKGQKWFSKKSPALNPIRYAIASVYYNSVSKCGEDAFLYGKEGIQETGKDEQSSKGGDA